MIFDSQTLINELGAAIKFEDIEEYYADISPTKLKQMLKAEGWTSKVVRDKDLKKSVRKWVWENRPEDSGFTSGVVTLNEVMVNMIERDYTPEQMQQILDMMSDYSANKDIRPETDLQECRGQTEWEMDQIAELQEGFPKSFRFTKIQLSYVRTCLFIKNIEEYYPQLQEKKTYSDLLEKREDLERRMDDPTTVSKMTMVFMAVPAISKIRDRYKELTWHRFTEYWGAVGTSYHLIEYARFHNLELEKLLTELESQGIIEIVKKENIPYFFILDEEKVKEYSVRSKNASSD